MGFSNVLFEKNIILDEEAFQSASKRFEILSENMDSLEKDINELLDELATGFDTPAGRKFINSCKDNLLGPIEDQSAVIKHVSDNLTNARTKYQSVFTEYNELNNMIAQG